MNKFDSKFEEQKSDSNVKYDKINAKFDEINNSFNEIEMKLNNKTLILMKYTKKWPKSQKNIDEKLNEINVKVIQQLDKLGRNIEFQKVSVCGGSNMTKICK